MNTPALSVFFVVLYTTRMTQFPNFLRVYHSNPIPPSLFRMPSSTTNLPGPTCCHPAKFFPFHNCVQPDLSITGLLTEVRCARALHAHSIAVTAITAQAAGLRSPVITNSLRSQYRLGESTSITCSAQAIRLSERLLFRFEEFPLT